MVENEIDARLDRAAIGATGADSAVGADSASSKSYPSREYLETVYLGPELPSRLDRLQAEWDVNRSELVRWLLDYALDAVAWPGMGRFGCSGGGFGRRGGRELLDKSCCA